jgi:hypothetical protein
VKCVDPFSDFKMQIPKMDKNFCPFSKCFTVYFSKKSEKTTSYHNAVNPDFSKNVCYHTFFWGPRTEMDIFVFWYFILTF